MSDELSAALLRRILVTTGFEYCEELFWREDDSVLTVYAKCSDFFSWGCADLEPIEAESDVELLERCLVDLRAAAVDMWPMWLTELYAARRRDRQPAGFMLREGSKYRIEPDAVRLLFADLGDNTQEAETAAVVAAAARMSPKRAS